MEIIKKIAIRILLLASLLIVTAFVYNRFFHDNFLKEHGVLLHRLNHSLNADYLFFSASSDYTYDPINDKDTTRVSIMIMSYSKKSIKAISSGAHHAGVFKELIKHIPPNKLEGIIVALNIRSFSPEWLTDENENALQQYAAAYRPNYPLISRLKVSLKDYPIQTTIELERRRHEHFKEWPLPYLFPKNNIENWCAVEKYGDWKNPKRQLADHYIKSYGFLVSEDHKRLKDFDEIVQLANQKGLKLIFHILPENIDEAEELIGVDLTSLMKRNRDFFIDRYHHPENNTWVIDNLEKARHEEFTDRDFPTEHYNQKGRTTIAKSIAEQINIL